MGILQLMNDAANTDDLLSQLTQTALHVAEARSAGVPVADAAKAMRTARTVKLTAAQRRRVRELMEDEGESRASAVAWVLNMETEVL